jgi:hypothetical protein
MHLKHLHLNYLRHSNAANEYLVFRIFLKPFKFILKFYSIFFMFKAFCRYSFIIICLRYSKHKEDINSRVKWFY